MQRRAAGHHDLQFGRGPQYRGDCGRRRDQVLEVVEQQQDPDRLQVAAQPVEQRPVTSVVQPGGLRDRGQDQIRVAERGQGYVKHAVGETARGLVGELEAEPGLAAAARAGERQQTAAFQQFVQVS
jgi:hypothetical protein